MGEGSAIIDYPTQPTDYLPHVITRCIEKAAKHGCPVRFALNGAEVAVQPGQTAAEVDAEVQRQWRLAAEKPVPRTSDPGMEAGLPEP
jgi:hypothetical protein